MALPSAVTMVTVRHTTNDVAGTLVAATVKVKPTARIWVPDGMMSLIPQDIPVTMSGDAAYSFDVPAVDDPLLVGEDVTFTVTEYFAGWRTTHQIAPTLAQAPGPVGLFETLVDGPVPGGASAFTDRIVGEVIAQVGPGLGGDIQAALDAADARLTVSTSPPANGLWVNPTEVA